MVVAGMPASGHVNPSLPLVADLVRREFDVEYYIDEQFRPLIERVGAQWRPYPSGTFSAMDLADATRAGGPLRVVATALPATEVLASFLVDQFRSRRPAAVLFDSNALWGYLAAASVSLPKVSLMTTLLLGAADYKRLTVREWRSMLLPMLPDVPRVLAGRRRLVRSFGKDAFPPTPVLPLRGDLSIFPIPRELQADNPLLDERCLFVGPSPVPPPLNATVDPQLATHLAGPDPVVLVSLGTLHSGSEQFFRSCFAALGDLPITVVLAVGDVIDPARLGPAPLNTLVRTFVPQVEILSRATVFVTHGGMNSVLEGLSSGVPLVVLPQQVEQLAIGCAVAERGAALVLRQHLAGQVLLPADLRAAVQRALDDSSLRSAASRMASTLGDGGGAVAAADAIEQLLARTP